MLSIKKVHRQNAMRSLTDAMYVMNMAKKWPEEVKMPRLSVSRRLLWQQQCCQIIIYWQNLRIIYSWTFLICCFALTDEKWINSALKDVIRGCGNSNLSKKTCYNDGQWHNIPITLRLTKNYLISFEINLTCQHTIR